MYRNPYAKQLWGVLAIIAALFGLMWFILGLLPTYPWLIYLQMVFGFIAGNLTLLWVMACMKWDGTKR